MQDNTMFKCCINYGNILLIYESYQPDLSLLNHMAVSNIGRVVGTLKIDHHVFLINKKWSVCTCSVQYATAPQSLLPCV